MSEMLQKLQEMASPMVFEPLRRETVTCFSTHFAQYLIRSPDLLVHLFPRKGEKDTYYSGRYLDSCSNCGARVHVGADGRHNACDRCGFRGLRYAPGRLEEKSSVTFPDSILELVRVAADRMWMGDVAIEKVDELGAVVVQFQRAKETAKVVGIEKFIDRFCEALDDQLDKEYR